MVTDAIALANRLVELVHAEGLDEFVAGNGIVTLAKVLGLQVFLSFDEGHKDRSAVLRFGQLPSIMVFRSGGVRKSIQVGPEDEIKLKVHERFSIAHEIAHWLAFKRFGVEPIEPVAARASEYWKHETAMHAFAGAVLVPRAVVAKRVLQCPGGMHLPAKSLYAMSKELRVSRIVAARQIALQRTDFGYLELQFQRDPKAPRMLLVVKESVASSDLKLPGVSSKIRNDRLVEVLVGSYGSQRFMGGMSFDGKMVRSLHMSWEQIAGLLGEAYVGEGAWVGRLVMTCWSKDNNENVFPI